MEACEETAHLFSLEEACELSKNIFEDIFDLNIDEFKQFLSSHQQFLKKDSYFDVVARKFADLPGNLIFNLCGSNGLCAGNTPLEAICQGVGEVLERMTLKKIYTNPELFPNVSDVLLAGLPSLGIKKFLEGKNYQCIIKDCSQSGAFPVVGLLVLDPSRTKYKLSLSSDLNFDIALQRCFTELFQGFSLDISFPLKMKKIFEFDKIDISNWKTIAEDSVFQEVFNQAKNGTGYLPLEFYRNSIAVQHLDAFDNENLNNLEVFKRLMAILEKMSSDYT